MLRSIPYLIVVMTAAVASIKAQHADKITYMSKTAGISSAVSEGETYVPLHGISGLLNCKSFDNPDKKKSVLSLNSHSVKVTAYSSFIIIDETKALQMPVSPIWSQNEVWVPVRWFLPVLNRHLPSPVLWNGRIIKNDARTDSALAKDDDISKEADKTNLLSLEWSKKQNGYLFSLKTSRAFSQNDLALWKNKQWLYLTVSDGRPSSVLQNQLQQVTGSGIIRKALLFQHKQSVQFSFQLSQDIEGQEAYYDEPLNSIQMLIRLPSADKNNSIKKDTSKSHSVIKQDKQWKIDKIVIDAGHGGKDPGAVGKGGTKEKTVTLSVALKLGKMIEDKTGVSVAYTRTTDEFVSLKNRTQFANSQNAKLFVSIHCNASKRRSAAGFETFFLSPSRNDEAQSVALLENEAIQFEEDRHEYGDFTNEKFILASMMQSVFVKESEDLADKVQNGLARKMTIKNRGVSQGPFYVLMGASMPSILVEAAFISNKSEEKFLKSDSGQQKIAEGIFTGLKQFIDAANKR